MIQRSSSIAVVREQELHKMAQERALALQALGLQASA
jgi:hypothetical protein